MHGMVETVLLKKVFNKNLNANTMNAPSEHIDFFVIIINTITLALPLILSTTYCTQNYAGIIGWFLQDMHMHNKDNTCQIPIQLIHLKKIAHNMHVFKT